MEVTINSYQNLSNYVLIDIREPYERMEYFHQNSIHIPMANLVEMLDQLSSDKNYVLHCQSGNRSLNLVKTLRAKGYTNFYSLIGGANELINAN